MYPGLLKDQKPFRERGNQDGGGRKEIIAPLLFMIAEPDISHTSMHTSYRN